MFWTDRFTELLKNLWAQGRTGGEIAKIMGLNRNAVLGKAYRIGLLGFRQPRERLDLLKERIKTIRKPPRRPPVIQTAPIAPQPNAAQRSFNGICGPSYDLMDLNRGDCHWPIGDPRAANFCYCAAPRWRGSYCRNHWAVAYQERTIPSGLQSSRIRVV